MAIESSIPSSSSSSKSVGTSTTGSDDKNAKAIEFIEEMTKNVDSIQKKVLAEILSQNGNTEYLQRFNLCGATDRDTFKSNVPVITYEDIKSDIQRIANGDKSPIFTSQPISEFVISSGTSSGEKKHFPMTLEELHRRIKLRNLSLLVPNLCIPDLDKGKALYFILTAADTKTPSGIPTRPVITSIYKTLRFLNKSNDHFLDFTSPIETILCVDSFQTIYCQMLCGFLMREQVLRIGTTFASGLLHAIRFLQVNWKQLSHDIKIGTLNHELVTDPSVRECMSRFLCKPNPELAEFINKECENGNWKRIIPRIWPHTKLLSSIFTGTMTRYIPTLDYYSGGLPLVSTLYASSECSFGLNLKPMSKPSDVSYTIMPNMGYFEFIHYKNDMGDSQPPISSESSPYLVDLANLEVGKKYEIVVTTYTGLCRYLMDDILEVTGFHNAAPQLKFVKRKNTVLSIHADKTSEEELQKGIDNASVLLQPYNIDVLDYTSCVDIKTIPGHYVIYWELLVKDSTKNLSQNVLNECCLAIEESFNWVYIQERREGFAIGPLEIRVVKNGTFEKLMDDAISRGVSINQYKVPRCVKLPSIIEMLDSRVVSKHFSPIPPRSIDGIQPTLAGSTISDLGAMT